MNDAARKRLQRLRDALDDMSGAGEPFGFGLLRPQPKVVATAVTWEYLETFIVPQLCLPDQDVRSFACRSLARPLTGLELLHLVVGR